MSSLSPLTPPPLHSLTNLYRADTVGEHSDVILLKVLSMDIEVRIKAARVLGESECMLCVCVFACVRGCEHVGACIRVCVCGCVGGWVGGCMCRLFQDIS